MNAWDMYKKWFYTWENATAEVMETWMRSPLVLEPAGACLSAFMKAKTASTSTHDTSASETPTFRRAARSRSHSERWLRTAAALIRTQRLARRPMVC